MVYSPREKDRATLPRKGTNMNKQVDPTRTDLVETRRIDGKRYILIAVEGEAAVNGVEINIP